MPTTPQPSSAIQQAYRAILNAIADQAGLSGDPVSIADLRALQLDSDDFAAICELHLVDFIDVFAEDPSKLARLFTGTLTPVELVWEVMQSDIMDESANQARLKQPEAHNQYYGGSTMTSRERMAHELGIYQELKL